MSILLQSTADASSSTALLISVGIALVVGAVAGIMMLTFATGRGIKAARSEADRVMADARTQAELAAVSVRRKSVPAKSNWPRRKRLARNACRLIAR